MKEAQGSQDEEEGSQAREARRLRIYKLGKTLGLIGIWAGMGLEGAVPGVTNLDMRDRLGCDVTMEDMGLVGGMKSLGIIVGSLMGGIVNDRFKKHCDLTMGVLLSLSAASMIFKPWSGSLTVLGLLYNIEGMTQGAMNAIGNAMIVMTWAESSASPMHAMHFGYGIGMMLAPLMAAPYLSLESPCNIRLNTTNGTSTEATWTPVTEDGVDPFLSQIEIPYVIITLVMVMMAVIFFIFYLVKPPANFQFNIAKPTETLKEVLHPRACAPGKTWVASILVVMFSLFWCMFLGKDHSLERFLFSYAVEGDLDFTKREAAWLDISYRMSFMMSRAIGIFVAHWVPIEPLFFIEVFCNAAAAVGMAVLGSRDKIALWVFSSLFAAFSGLTYPAGLLWTDTYIILTTLVVGVYDMGAGLGSFFFQWLSGYTMTNMSAHGVVYISMACSLFMCLELCVIQIFVSVVQGRRSKLSNNQESKQQKQTENNATNVTTI